MKNEYVNGTQPTGGTTIDNHDSFVGEEDIRGAALSLLDSAKSLRGLADKAKAIADEAEKEARKAETAAEVAMLSLIFGEGGQNA